MKVYVAVRAVEFEGDDVEGVFATEEKAKAFVSQQPPHLGVEWDIVEWEVES